MGLRTARSPAYGQRAMAVTGHSLASLAAIRIFEKGGNVADASIAASAASAAVLGHAAGLGGDCFLLFHEASSGKTYGLNASGTAPALADPTRFSGGMKVHGPLAPVVPGLVRAWEMLHRRFGRLPWRELFASAIDLAEAHPVSQVAAVRARVQQDEIAGDPGCASLYLPNGKPIGVGEILRQPALARTLRIIQDQGGDAFYHGEIGEDLAAFIKSHDGLLNSSDLAAYLPFWVEPVSVTYRDHRIRVMPPNSCGLLLLMQIEGLSAVESLHLAADQARRLGYQMNAMKAAFAEGVSYIADPRAVPNAAEHLLSAEIVGRIRQSVLKGASEPIKSDSSGTSCLMLADKDGNAISMVQSIFNVFGAALLDPKTGILFNNRMHSFTHKEGKPNSVGPCKRPAHTLCPVIVLRDGRLRFAMGTPGGLSQTLTNVQVLTNLVDCGLDAQAAVEAPRWCNTKTGDMLIEREFPESMVAELATMGHKAERRDDGYFYGSAKVVEHLPSGALAGGADFRREGFALGC